MLTKTSFTIRLHPSDDVVIARQQLVSGKTLLDENVTISGLIPPGHKVATRALGVGEPVKRYNQIIGFAKRPIAPGEHVHLHNLAMGEFARDDGASDRCLPISLPFAGLDAEHFALHLRERYRQHEQACRIQADHG